MTDVTDSMTWLQTIVLGVTQGVTEFLPISSSGHLRIVSSLFFDGDAGASFTAVTQLGTEAAVLVYFFGDIVRIVRGWLLGVRDKNHRSDLDYRIGWYVIVATIPILAIGYLLKDEIRTGARNLWVVASMLIVFSFVIAAAERFGSKKRTIEQLDAKTGITMGLAQCLALIPGVSRSGATASAGLFLGMERAAAVRFSFLLAIPAVLASGLYSLPDAFKPAGDGMNASGPQLIVATVIAFAVGYGAIAWMLGFVSKHSLYWFVGYRIILGALVLGLLTGGVISAT